MALDMYLTGEKYRMTDWDNPKNNLMEDGFRIKSTRLGVPVANGQKWALSLS